MVPDHKDQPPSVNKVKEERIKVAINPEHPEQTVMIGSDLTKKTRSKLCNLLQRSLDIFAWTPTDMTGVPRQIVEHKLNVRRGCPPVRQKKRGQAAERNIAINDEVSKLVIAVIMREVHYHDWLSNPVMVDAVLSLQSPKCLQDVQKLNGKLASLNRFLAKSAEKSLPFFKTLKKCRKNSDFLWTEEAEAAFKQTKEHIAKLPMLTALEEQEELIVYLAASKETVSAVLMTEREGRQMPIYFVSRALRGPEINYTAMEKLVLALVHASKRLRRYFQAHLITVITDQPIKNILSSLKVVGRMQKWSIQLGEFGIHYKVRVSVKGQILAYFIMETPEEEGQDNSAREEEPLPVRWTLFTDGSSCVDGCGAGVILTDPEGVEFTYALRFQFETTNNEAEYEALIAGLRIAEKMGVKNLEVNVDSKLVANQVNGTYIAKETDMIKYLEKVKALTNTFRVFSIKQVLRSKNKKGRCISKMASTSFAHLSKHVLVEELKEKSVNEREVLAVVEKEGDT
ncbi:reverse transcriptase domain-containing protein [Tanacetum coccineum]